MAEPAYHYAVGMVCTTLLSAPLALVKPLRKLLLLAPFWISLAGFWALIPDIPQIYREFPSLPFYETLGDMNLKAWFHQRPRGDFFFFHATIDQHIDAGAIKGLAIILILYNFFVVSYIAYFWFTRRGRVAAVPATYDDPAKLPSNRPVRLRPGGDFSETSFTSAEPVRETPPPRIVPPPSDAQAPRRPRPRGPRPY